ncbi:MAG: hypothetical protein EBR02_02265 [Alphaproteobacteria bacterium]|nr:hypothetical protein [Alphaproteobacteria bacterium]
MQNLKISLQNCYGIRSLDAELDFSKKKANIIYAANGMMKTSFAKTFKDLSEGKPTVDRIYKDRESLRKILDENDADIPSEEVFVVEPYVPGYESTRISTLLVNKELKIEYDEILGAISDKQEALMKELRKSSGLKKDIEGIISQLFTKENDRFLVALGRLEKEVLEEDKTELADINYGEIFNDKVEAFLNTKDFKSKLSDYTKVYDKLLSSSTFFRKGVFNHYQASEITKQLKNHGFFKAEHSVYLNPKTDKKEITTEEQLEEVIKKEKEAILTSPELMKAFEEIDSKLTTQDLRTFREYLLNHQTILPELANPELFKAKLWKAYLINHKEAYRALMDEYNKGKKRIQAITDLASQEATEWQNVINIFNRRFSVPFKVSIENKQDVILKRVTPNIKFEFSDDDEKPISIERNELIDILSNGERRALYILNIIFEVEARKSARVPTLFVIDDIADSFDYKNKYAIVEYLHDILNEDGFYQIILTHNYDFYRTVSGRLELSGARYHAAKTKEVTRLEKESIYKDVFEKWKEQAGAETKTAMLIAMIPFVRNLAQYCGYDDEEKKLTSLLHIKPETASITISNLQTVFRTVLKDRQTIELPNPTKLVKEVIYDEAASICANAIETMELEKKIALSIAIRLKTEEFLIAKINKPAWVEGLGSFQTAKLIREYKAIYGSDAKEESSIKIIERVNLMTPENIHLNSFMYEPILDMSNEHLKQLCEDVKLLIA